MQSSSNTTGPVKPEAKAWFLKGLDCLARGLKLDGARCFHQAVQLQPDYFDALFNLGLALQELGQVAAAGACYEQALRLRPDSAAAWNNLGLGQKQLGQWPQAVASHRRAVLLEPQNGGFLNNLAHALRADNQVEQAIELLEQGLRAQPAAALLWHTLGTAWRETGRLEESLAAYQRALQCEPGLVESHWDMAFTLLLQGDFRRGWEEYEWRWRRRDYPARNFPQPAWRGEELRGKRLLVYAEQGAGDTIQFARYLPLLVQRGARVVLECPRPLVRLLQTVPGLEAVIAKGEALPPVELQCALLSLPRLFRTTLDSIPTGVPYLGSRPEGPGLPAPAQPRAPGQWRVGLVWAGNPTHQNDAHRSISPEVLRSGLAEAGMEFYSLQLPRGLPAASPPPAGNWLVDLAPLLGDYADTAALLQELDLVISVDTSVAHLAGALGRPVWLLLPFAPDWRWLLQRRDSPWYPTMRLFRQPVAGDWQSVLKEVREALPKL